MSGGVLKRNVIALSVNLTSSSLFFSWSPVLQVLPCLFAPLPRTLQPWGQAGTGICGGVGKPMGLGQELQKGNGLHRGPAPSPCPMRSSSTHLGAACKVGCLGHQKQGMGGAEPGAPLAGGGCRLLFPGGAGGSL